MVWNVLPNRVLTGILREGGLLSNLDGKIKVQGWFWRRRLHINSIVRSQSLHKQVGCITEVKTTPVPPSLHITVVKM